MLFYQFIEKKKGTADNPFEKYKISTLANVLLAIPAFLDLPHILPILTKIGVFS
jgi:hypothetical protein